ncbi:MAG: hypothetical protein N2109_04490 [Fimbriimonadales bacterium]|nr:hypothetical protein [Fimbriimonadales bacterium]
MTVAIFEPNLFWAAKVRAAVQAAGWRCVDWSGDENVRVLVVGLYADPRLLESVTTEARHLGVPVIGHAGHKEKELLAFGRRHGCQAVLTNGELAHRLKTHVERIAGAFFPQSPRSEG